MLFAAERRWVDDYHADVLRIVGPQLEGEALGLARRTRCARHLAGLTVNAFEVGSGGVHAVGFCAPAPCAA